MRVLKPLLLLGALQVPATGTNARADEAATSSEPSLAPPSLPPEPRRYGDRGSSEIAIGIGYSPSAGFLGAGGFRYFVLDGVAPGVEGTYVSGAGGVPGYGLALGSLRLVPFREPQFAMVLTARAGRVFLVDHGDGWGVGGQAGVIFMLSANAGLEVGYEALRLVPANFCGDLGSCWLRGLVLGLRVVL